LEGRSAPGFDTQLNWSDPDAISDEEAESLIKWYAESHGTGTTEFTPFVPFLIENRPGALKRYRRYPHAIYDTCDLPQVTIAMLFLHYYIVIGNRPGVIYQVIAAREWGASKAEVLDMIQLAFLRSGPLGGNTAAAAAEYLATWPADEERRVDNPWPLNWDMSRLPEQSAAIDLELAGTELTDDERAAIRAWFASEGSNDPPIVGFLEEHAPLVLKALTARRAHAIGTASFPHQLIPLIDLHAATIAKDESEIARAALEARSRGVTRTQALGVVCIAFLYVDLAGLNIAARALDPIFADWH
jgi:hypothetical protein